jgi:gliding motility-associated-like protein
MKENDVDDLFKNSFENFEAKVKPSVWKNIKVALKWGGVGVVVKFILNKVGSSTVVAILSSAATVISTVMVMNWNNNADKANGNIPHTQAIIPVEKPMSSVVLESGNVTGSTKTEYENNRVVEELKPDKIEEKTNQLPVEPSAESAKEDKQRINSLIHSFSGQSIASISASPVGGSVPLIVNLENIGTGSTNKWTFSDGKKESNGSNPVHVFEAPGVYSVILTSTNAEGKTSIDSIKIEVTGNSSISTIPTLFSPNGDGIADVFTFQSKNMTNMEVEIFDKKGIIYYKWLGNGGKWDGKNLKGGKAKEGTYFYIITAEGVDGKKYEQKGAINLAR